MSKITIEVRLSDEDRSLLASVQTAAAAISGKAAPKAPKNTAPKGKPSAETDEFDDGVDGDATGEADAEAGEGDGEGSGDADDFGEGDGDGEATATKADVQAALREYATAPGSSKAAAIKLMKEKGGSDALSKLKEGKYQAVIDAAKAATKKAKAKK